MAKKPGKMMARRIFVIMLILIVALSGVSGASLVNIMILKGEEYQTKASEQQLYDSLVTAPRGDIFDRNMQVLATSSTAWTVYITPNGIKKIKDNAKVATVCFVTANQKYTFTAIKTPNKNTNKKIAKMVESACKKFSLILLKIFLNIKRPVRMCL